MQASKLHHGHQVCRLGKVVQLSATDHFQQPQQAPEATKHKNKKLVKRSKMDPTAKTNGINITVTEKTI